MIIFVIAVLTLIVFAVGGAFGDDVTLGVQEHYLVTRSTWQWGKPVTQTAYRYATVHADARLWVTEASLEAEWQRWLLRGVLAGGPATTGQLTHASANSYQEKSYSYLDGGHLLAAEVAAGYRLAAQPRWTLDGYVGVAYRQDHLAAYGDRGHVLGTLTGHNDNIARTLLVATETTTWVHPVLALRARVSLLEGLALTAAVEGTPWTWMRFEETRPMREGCASPCTKGETSGGWGVTGRAGVEYRLWRGLAATAGFEYGYMRAGVDDNAFHYRPAIPDCRQPRCQPVRFEFRTDLKSWGPFIGVEYRW